MSPFRLEKRHLLYLFLSALFLTNALLAELLGVKIFSLEASLGLPPAQLPLLPGYILDFNLTAGVMIWPVVFITTDLINEYFGREGVRRISFITAGLIVYAFAVIWAVTRLEPAAFWLELNSRDPEGQPFNINWAYTLIYQQGLGIIVGSITAFLLGQLLDAWVFQKLRRATGGRFLWLRATGSTVVSQLVDSLVVIYIAFYVFGNWPLQQILSVALLNYIYKFFVAVLLTPLLYPAHRAIDRYLAGTAPEQQPRIRA
ncbi:queuosine precursor transporter [Cesiribacter andamanensis]|uniref:Probable queuosine precursor transporter n=1 Tax=Cesiribacter andamanensis AMV16 TaxID=1279009 RepID=M7P144_9BACT|nr:queuosine precursor transporter [Cesiribacter andamanensis]EMR04299.1 Inner membrane protein yhhQ [Cesiribacter andamanensis AMV16]